MSRLHEGEPPQNGLEGVILSIPSQNLRGMEPHSWGSVDALGASSSGPVHEVAELDLHLVYECLASTSVRSWAVDRPPDFIEEYVESVRAYALPPALEGYLPVTATRRSPVWSAASATLSERSCWSDTGLRRQLNHRLAVLMAQRTGRQPPECRPQSDDSEALVLQYIKVI